MQLIYLYVRYCSLDLIYSSDQPGKKQLIERIEKLLGPHIIECSVKLGTGSADYELINID